MKTQRLRMLLIGIVVSAGLACPAAVTASDTPPDVRGCESFPNVVNAAINCPDRFAWEVFTRISAPNQPNGKPAWHGFATDSETFPATPVPNVCGTKMKRANKAYCPSWPDPKRKLPIVPGPAESNPSGSPHLSPFINNIEIVQRNQTSFNYIVANHLWYQQGLAKAFAGDFNVDFPVKSIEIKTNWIDLAKVPKNQHTTFHRKTYKGKTFGLVAMHITTKDLPQWFWATFEHKSNPGRCDWLGCRDSFGVEPAVIPAREALYGQYDPGKLKPELQEMLKRINPVFANYRLKGTQVTFVDDIGEPTLLGNSVTEFGFIQNASCMTCHSRATVNWQGTNGLGGFGDTPGGQTPKQQLPFASVAAPGQSFSGAPDPAWFQSPFGARQLLSMDFLWAMPFKAQSASFRPPKKKRKGHHHPRK